MDKSRYDEDADEWIVPFTKKKDLSEGAHGDNTHSSVAGVAGGGGSKMFPDINGGGKAGAGGGFLAQAGSTLRDPTKLNGKNGGSEPVESNARRSPVPLLTLPGNLMTTATLAQQQPQYGGGSSSGHYNSGHTGKGGLHLPQISSRSDANSARQGAGTEVNFSQVQILPQQPNETKKKKSKSKAPKGQQRAGGSAGGGIGYGVLGSARDAEGDYTDHTDQDNSCSSGQYAQYAQYAAVETKGGEEGAGESAGPLEDWGFQGDVAQLNSRAGGCTDVCVFPIEVRVLPLLFMSASPVTYVVMYLAVVSGPELEYSEDEDFIESAEDIISGSQYKQGAGDGPYPPAYGKHLQEGAAGSGM
jgi:hypothetical protein